MNLIFQSVEKLSRNSKDMAWMWTINVAAPSEAEKGTRLSHFWEMKWRYPLPSTKTPVTDLKSWTCLFKNQRNCGWNQRTDGMSDDTSTVEIAKTKKEPKSRKIRPILQHLQSHLGSNKNRRWKEMKRHAKKILDLSFYHTDKQPKYMWRGQIHEQSVNNGSGGQNSPEVTSRRETKGTDDINRNLMRN